MMFKNLSITELPVSHIERLWHNCYSAVFVASDRVELYVLKQWLSVMVYKVSD